MAASGLRIGTFAGAAIIIDPTFLILGAYVLGQALLSGGLAELGPALLFVLAIFIAVLLHEFGHAGTAALFKLPSKRIVLTFFGGHVEFAMNPEKRWHEIAVSAAGPLANIATYVLLLGAIPSIASLLPHGTAAPAMLASLNFLQNLAYVSLLLGLFNLAPGFPLDGGRILTAALSYAMKPARARLISAVCGILVAAALAAYAASVGLTWSLFIALFLALSAWAEIQRANAALKDQSPNHPSGPTTSNA